MKKSLFGYGKTTRSLAEIFGKKIGGFNIYDDNFLKPSEDNFGNKLLPPNEFDPNASELEIPSPGFPPTHFLVQKAKNLQSEYDFFYDAMPKSIWISGTNGKTTTTQMTAHLLSHIEIAMGGNIGIPLAQLNLNAKLWILETSSFTLHYTKLAKPEIYALLPIGADHLSWHGNFEKYVQAKLSVLERLNECDIAIIPQTHKDFLDCKAYIISYKNEFDLAKKMGINIEKIRFQTPFLLDATMALSIEKILLDTTSYDILNNFTIEENKLEELYDKQGRLWVNDTKATNEDAVKAALNRYKTKNIHLILGGDDKGVDLNGLFYFLKNFKIHLYLIGKSADSMIVLAQKHQIQASKCEILSKAVKEISKILQKTDIALLSPACSSLDQFSSYIQRGELFKQYINQLEK
ncbi:UDP-N-acetylmuramoyl-L-alanine--D-glutamate ligase [Campylobacter sp. MIT 21-1685]|uniref:UDP-N-acetylmuramoyl-L-alanine--D-glutamate ligase n=1 Tax=unclassified Campylobacter TaxID=2593542 RepID=UPI00224B2017|nr:MULTISPECIES: UDP-N-acetylmuramoyl-L-alanine--D-glutamate ligase [unclassified Campylobacter]MCX2682841.1 UDP-N-acetylmuramoyl-L-alanine--D-glutamate ligase [Campylobacter sp. MIT 21-1684]MCX2751211.1 UDP-N-acetylmuramoyl-L-alanine--D-glutamate ligase [Campylobacter sp. MIT 21-1682]MCX2807322.1 UDP-N-acetylmuramoyl-L-alanine--D-glutamate ligase [Campylobacter sp. MIT 21-1685]